MSGAGTSELYKTFTLLKPFNRHSQMDRSNCHILLNNCTTLKRLQQLHAQSVTQGLCRLLQPLSCKILNSYARLGEPDHARKVFAQIPDPDIVTLTSIMTLHLQTNQAHRAVSVFADIISIGRTPDGFAVVGALSASGQTGNLFLGKLVHGLIYRHKLGRETIVNNALIDMYCRNGKMQLARSVFTRMGTRSSVTWSSMLHGYVKCEGLESASLFFDGMLRRDVVSWTVMITGHVQGKRPVRALELFRRMNFEGHRPTSFTIVGVLSACADTGALDLGCALHGYIAKMNLGSDCTIVYNALIDTYSKSGNLEMAEDIFNQMLLKDVYTWTSMISGFAVHGKGKQAIEVFGEMLSSRTSPNEVTFVAVLLACSHSGLIEEGRYWFNEMRKVYKLYPQIEHYGCMVDLLGRAGLLKEAEELIRNMGRNPDCVIWRSLLSACLVHGNAKLAEIAGKEIIKQEPEDDGACVLLWNMYASSNRWEEALQMRKKMRDRSIVKRPGCSWIEVDGLVHEFLVDDRMHYFRKDIFSILEDMSKHLKVDATVLEEYLKIFMDNFEE